MYTNFVGIKTRVLDLQMVMQVTAESSSDELSSEALETELNFSPSERASQNAGPNAKHPKNLESFHLII